MFPLSAQFELAPSTDLFVAVALGLGFGFCLERAGFGSARRLTAVFYFFDMAVVKVMFTAIVTAMGGIAILATAGALDPGQLYVEPTQLGAQVLGGLIFGAGFIIGGYCPGTAVTAMASGRLDGFAFAGGLLAGVLAYAELTPGIEAWTRAGARPDLTLPGLTGIPMGWWAAGFALALLAAARGMSWLEARFADGGRTR